MRPAWLHKLTSVRSLAQIAFFATVLGLGLAIHRDYGISFDERQQRSTGGVNLKYVVERVAPHLLPESANRLPALQDYADRDYGVAFELPAAALEVLLGLEDDREIMFFRHLLTFLVAFAGIVAVSRMAYFRFGDWRLALVTASFLVLSPRLFAESFYNSKDIVFMALFAIAAFATLRFVLRPNQGTAFLAALATAIAIDVRIMAVILPAAATALLGLRAIRRDVPLRAIAAAAPVYAVTLCLAVLPLWPWLWSDPVGNFAQAFASMARFRWDGDVLYLGSFVSTGALPWHYALVWISVTTPLLYLALFAAGSFAIVRRAIGARLRLWNDDNELQDLFYLGLVVVPVAAVIILHSVMYDGWRQLYFVYPALLLVAARGLSALWRNDLLGRPGRFLLLAVTATASLHTAWWMWNAHPFQNVYFNRLAGPEVGSRFELDYWALANRRGLEYVLATDPDEVVTVAAASFMPLATAENMLPLEQRRRIELTAAPEAARYVFTNYRLVRDPAAQRKALAVGHDLYYEIKVDGEPILTIYRRKA